MDDADRASKAQFDEIDELLRHHKNQRQPPVHTSADNCEECGLQIPSERQVAVPGCSMCTQCAARYELIRQR